MFRDLKNFILKLCRNKLIWNFTYILVNILGLKSYKERLMKMDREERFFKTINFSKTVARGPFKGMQYNSLESYCSDTAPKIIGSYESELNPAIEEILQRKYSDIIDIGCAEGYYAVGLAMRLPEVKIHAFDAKEEALDLCRVMARTNGVYDRIVFNGFCDEAVLKNFHFKGRGLVVCDCEGYEIELFTASSIKNLTNCDILIELHDMLNPEVSKTILPLFESTHDVHLIPSQIKNPALFEELKPFNDLDQKIILSESRDGILGDKPMYWAYIVSRN